jgi:outer membrane protein OmpA-like peptidoglycan-associated protein
MDVIYLGQGQITNTGVLSTSFPVPPGTNIGNYILQLNGVTNDRQVRSVNLPLKILPKRISRGLIRRGCYFAPNSAKLTRSCERYLRAAAQRIPKGASSVRVNIVGVSVSQPTRAKNRFLARKRARAVAFYLRAIGVRGKVTRTIVISRKRARGPVASRIVVVRRGTPLTTVIFSFNR